MHKSQNLMAGFQSFRYLLYQICQYRWYSVLLPVIACVTQILLSLILIIMPKIVLDAVQESVSAVLLRNQIIQIGVVLAVITIANMAVHNALIGCSQGFLYTTLTVLWEKKAVSLDYAVFLSSEGKLAMEKARQAVSSPNWGVVEFLSKITSLIESLVGLVVYCAISLDYAVFLSSEGKLAMEKARQAVSSPNWGVVEFLSKITSLIESLVGLVVYCAIVGRLHFFMIAVLVLMFGIELVWGVYTEGKKQTYKDDRAAADRRINYLAYRTNGLEEGKDIRIFSVSRLLEQIGQKVISDKAQIEGNIQKWTTYHLAVTAFLIVIRDGFAYLILCWLFIQNNISLGDFTLYFAAITGVGNWLTKLSDAVASYVETNHYIVDFWKFMQLPDEETHKKPITIDKPITFTFQNVSFSYRTENIEAQDLKIKTAERGSLEADTYCIHNLNLEMKGGEKIAVVGANGAGKTTFVKLLCGALRPSTGKILVNGIDSQDFARCDYYKLFAVVLQKAQILPVSVADNIAFGSKEEDNKKRLQLCIDLAGLRETVEALPDKEHTMLGKRIVDNAVELSGGQKQRLFLARALYKDTPVLVLDEPTAALDAIAEHDIYQKYSQLTEGKTSIFVSHRLASTRFCDRIIFMEKGAIVECGTHSELMQLNGKYAQMFRVQSKYYQQEGMENAEKWENA